MTPNKGFGPQFGEPFILELGRSNVGSYEQILRPRAEFLYLGVVGEDSAPTQFFVFYTMYMLHHINRTSRVLVSAVSCVNVQNLSVSNGFFDGIYYIFTADYSYAMFAQTVGERCPLPPEIGVKSDPRPL